MKGKHIVVTRAVHQAGELCELLETQGAEPLLYPCIDIVPPENIDALDDALQSALDGVFDWLILTSSNTVLALAQRLETLHRKLPESLAVAAIGHSTAQAARDLLNMQPDLVPDKYVAEAMIEALQPIAGRRVFLPQSNIARPILAEQLAAAGAEVTTVAAYRTVVGSGGVDLPVLLAANQVDAITFTSSSTVRNFHKRIGNHNLDDVCIACIGPITSKTAEETGLPVTLVPENYTLEGLVNALETHFS